MREVHFQDADFPHRSAWCRSPLEGRSLRWVPYGMPRLNHRFQHMVFFLYGRHPKTGEIVGPKGTGFFVGMESRGVWLMRHFYAVTCHHVAVSGGGSIIRINTQDGGSRFIEFEPDEWQFIPNGDDMCAVDVTDRLANSDDFSVLPPNLVAWKDFLADEFVGIGEDGFMLGLFADHAGKRQNLIASRFGNLSLLAHDDETIEQPNGIKRPSHIFDMRSRPGFSGSPVFIYRTPSGDLREAAERGGFRTRLRSIDFVGAGGDFGYEMIDHIDSNYAADEKERRKNTFLMLLGIHAGQYSERVEARKIKKTAGESDDVIRDRDKLKIPSSMALVVPAWEIINLLKQPIFLEQRTKRDDAMQKQRDQENVAEPEANVDAAVAPPAEAAGDANPNHLTDFTRLVDVAARKKPKD